jgi:steroid delta-isomerase
MVRWLGACVALLLGCHAPGDASADAERDIRAALLRWPEDWNARKLSAVCGLFAADVVLSFPGTPDRGHREMCDGFAAVLGGPRGGFRYDPPDIEEVLVSGDLAVVRLRWTSRAAREGASGEVIERERGIDVFRRGEDGIWRILRSHAYPEVDAQPR